MSEQQENPAADVVVVVDHHHDSVDEVYRLTIGFHQVLEVPVLDEDGNQVFEELDRVEDGDGNEVVIPGPAKIELRSELVPVEDFVFSAADERWEGKTPEEVAREQRRLVRKALRDRAAAAEAAARAPAQLPGVGDGL